MILDHKLSIIFEVVAEVQTFQWIFDIVHLNKTTLTRAHIYVIRVTDVFIKRF